MPIRLNLLAEAQAAEEARRRDPVKRAMWVAALLISLMLVWSSSLQLKAMMANRELNRLEGQMTAQTNEYKQVVDNQKRIEDIKRKNAALHQLAANRFLHGSLLNALQQTNVDSVQLVRLKMEQSYVSVDGVKARTNEYNKVVPARPGTSTERIVLLLDANDASANPGDQVNKFQEAVGGIPFVHECLGRTNVVNLKTISPPQVSTMPGPGAGKASRLFQLECRFQEKTR